MTPPQVRVQRAAEKIIEDCFLAGSTRKTTAAFVARFALRERKRALREAAERFFCGHKFNQREDCSFCQYRHEIMSLFSTPPKEKT